MGQGGACGGWRFGHALFNYGRAGWPHAHGERARGRVDAHLRPHLHGLLLDLRRAKGGHARVHVPKGHVHPTDIEWPETVDATRVGTVRSLANFGHEAVAELDDAELVVPELVRWELRRRARAEEVDRAKVPLTHTVALPLDPIVTRVPRAVLGLVGDAEPAERACARACQRACRRVRAG